MFYLRDMKAQCVPRVAPCVLLRATDIKLSYLLILNAHYSLSWGFKAYSMGGGVFNAPATLWHLLLLVQGSKTGTIGHAYTRACMREFLQSHGASKWAAGTTAGVRRARTGGGIRACRWGWTGTGERTDGSSAGSKRASRALLAIFLFPYPPFLSRLPLRLRWGDNQQRISCSPSFQVVGRVRVSSTFTHSIVPVSLSSLFLPHSSCVSLVLSLSLFVFLHPLKLLLISRNERLLLAIPNSCADTLLISNTHKLLLKKIGCAVISIDIYFFSIMFFTFALMGNYEDSHSFPWRGQRQSSRNICRSDLSAAHSCVCARGSHSRARGPQSVGWCALKHL